MMKMITLLMLVALGGLVLQEYLVSSGAGYGEAEAAQTATKKKPVKKTTSKPKKKKTYCGYDQPPIQAGMSNFCAREYDLFCRRGVGCNKYGF